MSSPLLPSPSGLNAEEIASLHASGQGQRMEKKSPCNTWQLTILLDSGGRPCAGQLCLPFNCLQGVWMLCLLLATVGHEVAAPLAGSRMGRRYTEDPPTPLEQSCDHLMQGTPAYEEEGAGVQGTQGKVEGSPCAQRATEWHRGVMSRKVALNPPDPH